MQRMFVAEPYILWRNSRTPGRWGLRLLGLGAAARYYHWTSALQGAGLRLRVDPPGFAKRGTYSGHTASLGWIIGAGRRPSRIEKSLAQAWAWVRRNVPSRRSRQSLIRSPRSARVNIVRMWWSELLLKVRLGTEIGPRQKLKHSAYVRALPHNAESGLPRDPGELTWEEVVGTNTLVVESLRQLRGTQ